MRNMPGTVLLPLLTGQPASFLKVLRRLGQMAVGVDISTWEDSVECSCSCI